MHLQHYYLHPRKPKCELEIHFPFVPEAEFSLLRALDYRLVAQKIERIGDKIKEISEIRKKAKNIEFVLSKVDKVADIYELAFFAFMKEDVKDAYLVWDKIRELTPKVTKIKKKIVSEKDVYAVEIFNNLKQIVEDIKDIADLVHG